MKLLLFTNLFPTPIDPQRGVFTLQLASRLARHSEVTVVCPLPWFPRLKLAGFDRYRQYAEVPIRYRIADIEVHSPKYPLLPRVSENHHAMLMALVTGRYLRRLHATRQFDVVNSQWLYPDSVAADRIFTDLDIAHVATGLGCDVNHDLSTPKKGRQILPALDRCDAVTVVANSMRTLLVDRGIDARKVFTIPNGIDHDRFKAMDKAECRKVLGMKPDGPVVLYVGRLSEEKSVATLLDAVSTLCNEGISLNLYIVGTGPLEASLRSDARKLGIEQYLYFIGNVPHEEVRRWISAADYLCLPSLREGCPNVVLEALACGKPVIASRVGAVPDLVNQDSGRLFAPGDTADLADALRSALNSRWEADKIANSVRGLTWERAADQYLEVFRQAIHGQEGKNRRIFDSETPSVAD